MSRSEPSPHRPFHSYPQLRERGPLAPTTAAWLVAALLSCPVLAQPGTGSRWWDFGPSGSNGSFVEITRVIDGGVSAYAVAADPLNRVLTLTQWKDAQIDLNLDCAVTRHFQNARTLDMDVHRRARGHAPDRPRPGRGQDDHCLAMDVDAFSRPVIVGHASTDGPDAAFVVRLAAADGAYDNSFSSNGKFTLENLVGFARQRDPFLGRRDLPRPARPRLRLRRAGERAQHAGHALPLERLARHQLQRQRLPRDRLQRRGRRRRRLRAAADPARPAHRAGRHGQRAVRPATSATPWCGSTTTAARTRASPSTARSSSTTLRTSPRPRSWTSATTPRASAWWSPPTRPGSA